MIRTRGDRAAVIKAVALGVIVISLISAALIGYFAIAPGTTNIEASTRKGSSSQLSSSSIDSSSTPGGSSPIASLPSLTTTTSYQESSQTTTATLDSILTPQSSSSSPSNSSTQSGVQPFPFTLSTNPSTVLLAPGLNATYVILTITPPPTLLTSGSELVVVNGSSSDGVLVQPESKSVTLSINSAVDVPLWLSAGNSTRPGNYTTQIRAYAYSSPASSSTNNGPSTTQTIALQIKIVQYLVYMQGYDFAPHVITVKPGSTVFWMNLDPSESLSGIWTPGDHTVTFTSGVNATSEVLHQFDSYSLTFLTAGTYAYHCTIHPASMQGTVVVVSQG